MITCKHGEAEGDCPVADCIETVMKKWGHRTPQTGFLYEQEFYELMQVYRHAPLTPQINVQEAFDNIREFIKKKVV